MASTQSSWSNASNARRNNNTLQRSHAQMRQRHTRPALLLLALLVFSPTLLAQTLDERLKEIDEYAAKAGREWKVPGFSVAVVKDDKVVFAKGYGVREMGRPEQ